MEKIETIVFGGGCFWCTEAVFTMLKGVHSVTSGYAGGTTVQPTYKEVCAGGTGHAEVIRVEYDPRTISLEDLLSVFFATHDPTTPNRQGNDVGEQYRSLILYQTEAQKTTAEQFISQLNNSSREGKPIVTEVKPLKQFYPAEASHQQYYARNQQAGYCQVVIHPKLEKAKKQFARLLQTATRSFT